MEYPELAPVVRRYLSGPASSAASEREFEQSKQITKDKARLKPANAEMLLFLKYNMRAIEWKLHQLEEAPREFEAPNRRAMPVPVVIADEVEYSDLSESSESETEDLE